MQLFRSLSEKISLPLVLTIGNFDGIHLGHQKVLDRVKELSHEKQMSSAVLTFENHPSTILKPETPVRSLYSLSHKCKLLEEYGIDVCIVIPFTWEFSQLIARDFLEKLRNSFHFTHLVLGHDAAFGKERQGNRNEVKKISRSLHFVVEYVSPLYVRDVQVSSSVIRSFLQEGKLELVEYLLDRKYSFYGVAEPAFIFEYPAAKLELKNLCLPLSGAYAVKIIHQGKLYNSVGYLSASSLEVLVLSDKITVDKSEIEVIFYRFMHPEISNSSADEKQRQIGQDIQEMTNLL